MSQFERVSSLFFSELFNINRKEMIDGKVFIVVGREIPVGFGDVEVFGKLDCQTVPTRDTSVIRQADSIFSSKSSQSIIRTRQ